MPRTVFSRKQLAKLEERFVQQTFLSKEERLELAEALKLTDRQVMVWFQNRRYVFIDSNIFNLKYFAIYWNVLMSHFPLIWDNYMFDTFFKVLGN